MTYMWWWWGTAGQEGTSPRPKTQENQGKRSQQLLQTSEEVATTSRVSRNPRAAQTQNKLTLHSTHDATATAGVRPFLGSTDTINKNFPFLWILRFLAKGFQVVDITKAH